MTHHFQPLTLVQGPDSLPARRSIFSDDHLWMPLVVPAYIKETGDVSVLDETAPYLDEGEGTVIEHLVKTLRFSHTAKGRHGLSLVMAADWNDCMSVKWGGESVWTSFLYYRALNDMIELARFVGRSDVAAECESMRRELQETLDEHAWDGFTMDRLLRGSRCHIDVRRTGVPGITLNGEAVEGDTVPYERLAADELYEISVAI